MRCRTRGRIGESDLAPDPGSRSTAGTRRGAPRTGPTGGALVARRGRRGRLRVARRRRVVATCAAVHRRSTRRRSAPLSPMMGEMGPGKILDGSRMEQGIGADSVRPYDRRLGCRVHSAEATHPQWIPTSPSVGWRMARSQLGIRTTNSGGRQRHLQRVALRSLRTRRPAATAVMLSPPRALLHVTTIVCHGAWDRAPFCAPGATGRQASAPVACTECAIATGMAVI